MIIGTLAPMMHRLLTSFFFLLLVLTSTAQDITGTWHGMADFSGSKLRIDFNIDSLGTILVCTIDSPDQDALGMPCSSISFVKDSLEIQSDYIQLTYKGQFRNNKFHGFVFQGGYKVPLLLQRDFIPASKPHRPQEPNEPYGYAVSHVSIKNPDGGHTLAGTLTVPNGQAKSPLAILISGSGPQDRDETIMDHKPFWVLADHLTQQGIAVLRYDDRGVGESGGTFAGATSEDFASDVDAIIDWALSHNKIDPMAIGLIGHSEGGMIAPMVAAENQMVSFVVMLAGPGTSGREIILDQTRLIMESSGSSESDIVTMENMLREVSQVIQFPDTTKSLDEQLRPLVSRGLEAVSDEEAEAFGGRDKMIDLRIEQFKDPWYQYFMKYNPKEAIKFTRCPVLAINGLLDLQVPCSKNLSAIEYALKLGGNPDFEIHAMPGLNHLFQHSETGSVAEYGLLEETLAPEVSILIGEWINARF